MPSFNYETTTGFASVSIKPGRNAFRLPEEPLEDFTASSLLQAINEQNPDGQAVQLDKWNAAFGRWDSHHIDFPFRDFPIEAGETYYLNYEGPAPAGGMPTWAKLGAAMWVVGLIIITRKRR